MDSDIPKNGLVRLSRILQLVPVARSTWWAGVKSGRFPKPVKLGPRTTCWYWQDIQLLIEKPPQRPEPAGAAASPASRGR